jgi:hypothetical protein
MLPNFASMLARFAIAVIATSTLLAQAPTDFKAPKEVAPGVFEIGAIRLDKNAGTVVFPAKVNMDDGLVEYLMVTKEGPVHESVLVTEVQPQEVHMAMLLLGAKGMERPGDGKGPERIDAAYLAKAPKLTGDAILLSAKWKDKDGTEHTAPPERWLTRKIFTPKKPAKIVTAEDGPWLYTGSFFYENRFIAQVEGTFAALVTFPSALINNPRTGSNDDHIWFVKKEVAPPVGTPVEFTITLQPSQKSEK